MRVTEPFNTKSRDGRQWPAAVFPEDDPRAAQVARAVPERAKVIRIGKTGKVIAGYVLSPDRVKAKIGLLELRVREIERLITHRFRELRITTDDDRMCAEIVASHLEPNAAERWVRRWCPNLKEEAGDIVAEAVQLRRRWTAAALGKALQLTWQERIELRIRTFRAADVKPAEAKRLAAEVKRERDRVVAEEQRRAKGVTARKKGDSATAEAAAAGVDRRTIQRRRKRAMESECRSKVANTTTYTMCDFQAAFGARGEAAAKAVAPLHSAVAPSCNAPDRPNAAPDQASISADPPISAIGWSPKIILVASDPRLARLGKLVAAQAAAHRLAEGYRRAA